MVLAEVQTQHHLRISALPTTVSRYAVHILQNSTTQQWSALETSGTGSTTVSGEPGTEPTNVRRQSCSNRMYVAWAVKKGRRATSVWPGTRALVGFGPVPCATQ